MKRVDNNGNKVIFFKNDDEFEQFYDIQTKMNHGDVCLSWYVEPGSTFQKALEDGFSFMICDKDSKINKRGCVSYHTACGEVENLIDNDLIDLYLKKCDISLDEI